jgi:hypothetical protein
MYSNIPAKELLEVIELMCNQNDLNKELRHEIMKFHKILTKRIIFNIEIYHIYKKMA